jgi:hypothetical protein
MTAPTTAPEPLARAEAFRFWLQLGCISFGGPAGQIAIMHNELVDGRRWISEKRFLHALSDRMLLPGARSAAACHQSCATRYEPGAGREIPLRNEPGGGLRSAIWGWQAAR